MSKSVTSEVAFSKTFAMSVLLGAVVPLKTRLKVLLIDPLLQEEKQIDVQ